MDKRRVLELMAIPPWGAFALVDFTVGSVLLLVQLVGIVGILASPAKDYTPR